MTPSSKTLKLEAWRWLTGLPLSVTVVKQLDRVDRDLRDELGSVDVAQVLGDRSVVERADDADVGQGLRVLDRDGLFVGRLVERRDAGVVREELQLLEELAFGNHDRRQDARGPVDSRSLVGRQDPDLEGFAPFVDDVFVLADRAAGGAEGHDADGLLAGKRSHVEVRVERRLRARHDLRAVEIEVHALDVLGGLRLEPLEARHDLLGDRQKRDRRGQQADVLDLPDDGLPVGPGRGDLGGRRIGLLGNDERFGDAALGVLVAVGHFQDELVVTRDRGIAGPSAGSSRHRPRRSGCRSGT